MAAVSLSPSSLPRDLRKDEKEFLPQEYLNAYDKILYAEDYASQNGLGDQVMHARVVGYLIIEFLKREDLYGATPCETITRGILGPKEPPGVHDVVFKLGEWYKNNFLRMCMFGFFTNHPGSQFIYSLDAYDGVPRIQPISTPFASII